VKLFCLLQQIEMLGEHIPERSNLCFFQISQQTSYANPGEVDVVIGIVHQFLSGSGGDIRASDIGIVTPYSAQVRLIKERCRVSPFDAVEVASVDGFQGREKQVIVFSCVRANSSGNLGFLADARRVNVMMTRAKRGLVIVGSPITLRAERGTWAPWLLWAHENGLIVGGAPVSFALDFIKTTNTSAVNVALPVASVLSDPICHAYHSVAASGSKKDLSGNAPDLRTYQHVHDVHIRSQSRERDREKVNGGNQLIGHEGLDAALESSERRSLEREILKDGYSGRSRSRDGRRGRRRHRTRSESRDRRISEPDGRDRSRSRSRGRARDRNTSRSRSRDDYDRRRHEHHSRSPSGRERTQRGREGGNRRHE
jgi:hypothetical protein